MNTAQINENLQELFHGKGHRIVFWNDPEQEFLSLIDREGAELVDGVTMIRLDKTGAFETKLRVERTQPDAKFLIYSPAAEPEYEDDWLLDIRLYSYNFRADRASILLDELGLEQQHLRNHLMLRRKFFDNKERLAKLKNLVLPGDLAEDLDRKMLAVLIRSDQPELFNLLRSLFHTWAAEEDLALNQSFPLWEEIGKYELQAPFWQMVRMAFGYSEESPSPGNLLIRLFVTDFLQKLNGETPGALINLDLPPAGHANVEVCMAQWRDSNQRSSSYDLLSEEVSRTIHLSPMLDGFELEDLLGVMSFLAVEKAVCRGLRDRVISTRETMKAEAVREIASRREAGHWVSAHVASSPGIPRDALRAVYRALVTAADFFELWNASKDGFEESDALSLYRYYEQKGYRFDQLYRHFCEASDKAESENWDILKDLRADVEATYVNGFSSALALSWGKVVDRELLAAWKLDGVSRQQNFYQDRVQPRLRADDKRRAFVIISDALRYEVAEELKESLNGKYRMEAELESQLGVLPSYTRLGMASLLPHQSLSYNDKAEVFLDGKPTVTLEQRNEILGAVDGMALRGSELLGLKTEDGRKLISGKRVVYIYHDRIDAIGDDRKTEGETFEAVRKAIEELTDLVRYVIDRLNGNHVLVTADHGFLFTESAPRETDKSKMPDKPSGTVVAKKRYLIGKELGQNDEVYHGQLATTASAEGGMEFWLPKGTSRFHFMGGARFYHGGAMLQEVVVPVLTVLHKKGKSAGKTKTQAVTVNVLGSQHKITTARHRFDLLQMEAVSDRMKAITLKIAIYEGGEPVTDIETITFDSASDNLDERRKSVTLVLRDRPYNKKTNYRLVLRDAESDVEQQSMDVTIDRAFTNDF